MNFSHSGIHCYARKVIQSVMRSLGFLSLLGACMVIAAPGDSPATNGLRPASTGAPATSPDEPTQRATAPSDRPVGLPATPPRVLVVRLDGGIFSGTADYIIQNVHRAEQEGIPFLLVMDTPGGALEATREIVKAFLGARVPIVVWVGPSGARAGSAGVFVTMAANVAAMAPHTNIGAAHPIGMGVGAPGDDEEKPESDGTPGAEKSLHHRRDDQEVLAQKIENDTLAFIESIAAARKRNVQWGLSAVKDSVSVTAEKALELKVIDLLASDVSALLAEIDGRVVETAAGPVTLHTRDASQVEVPMTFRQRLIEFLSDPNLIYVLFVLGMLGIYLELSHPGAILPAVVGGVSIILALTGMSVLPYNATGLLFLAIAGACFVAEAYVTSFGLLALGGAAALIVGAILLFDVGGLEDLPGLKIGVSPRIYLSVAALSLAFVLPIAYLVARSQARKPVSGREGLMGLVGKTITAVDSRGGRVFVHGEYWEARSRSHLEPGEEMVVIGIQGLTLEVGPRT